MTSGKSGEWTRRVLGARRSGAGLARPPLLQGFQTEEKLFNEDRNMTSVAKQLRGQRISRRMAARLLGVSRARISQLEQDAIIHSSDGLLVLGQLLDDWFSHLQTRNTSARINDDGVLRKMKIDGLEMRVAAKEHGLIPADWVKAWVVALGDKLHELYKPVPARFTVDRADQKRLQRMIDDIHTDFVREVEKPFPKPRQGASA